MTKLDSILIAACLPLLIAAVVMRIWFHSHLREAHPVEFDVVEQSYERPWIFFLDYPLSECHRNSLTHFLYRTCWRGNICRDCQWTARMVATADAGWVITATVLLVRMNF